MKHNRNKNTYNIRPEIIICLFLVISTLTVYWNVRHFDFVNYDDNGYVVKNHYVNKGITIEGIKWAFSFSDIAYWHPITWFSHMLDCQLYGVNSGMHHSTNLIFHIVNVLLVFFILKRMTREMWKSAFVAALFALHPINVESVAWIAERKNILSAFFGFLVLLSYIGYTEKPCFIRYLIIFIILLLGLMTKPMLITLPAVLFLLDYWPLRRFYVKKRKLFFNEKKYNIHTTRFHNYPFIFLIVEKIPLLLLSIVSVIISISSFRAYSDMISTESVPIKLRIANAFVSYIRYLEKMLWPVNLTVYYPFPETLPIWQVIASFILLIGIFILVGWQAEKRPFLVTGWLWYIGTLIPVIGIKQAGLWPAMADRWAYMPIIGIFIIVAWLFPDLCKKLRINKRVIGVGITVIFFALMITTWKQTKYWNNSITLFKHAIDVTGDNELAHYNIAIAYGKQGYFSKAINHYREALRINPLSEDTHMNLGIALAEQNRFSESINHYREALRINPKLVYAYYNIGNVFAKQGQFNKAIIYYNKSLKIKPNFINSYYNMGNIFMKQNKIEDAIRIFTKGKTIKPENVKILNNLGIAFVKQGQIEEAVKNFKKALQIKPDFNVARNNLNRALKKISENQK